MTGSKKVVEILNRYGYCTNYTIIEEIEYELTFSVTSETRIFPKEMVLDPGFCIGIAFDNFDRFVETLSRKDTLHDTMGIAYQRKSHVDTKDSRESHLDRQRREEEEERGG